MSLTTTDAAQAAISRDNLRDILDAWPGSMTELARRACVSRRTLDNLRGGSAMLTRDGAARFAETLRRAAFALTTCADLLMSDCPDCRAEMAERELTDAERAATSGRCLIHD